MSYQDRFGGGRPVDHRPGGGRGTTAAAISSITSSWTTRPAHISDLQEAVIQNCADRVGASVDPTRFQLKLKEKTRRMPLFFFLHDGFEECRPTREELREFGDAGVLTAEQHRKENEYYTRLVDKKKRMMADRYAAQLQAEEAARARQQYELQLRQQQELEQQQQQQQQAAAAAAMYAAEQNNKEGEGTSGLDAYIRELQSNLQTYDVHWQYRSEEYKNELNKVNDSVIAEAERKEAHDRAVNVYGILQQLNTSRQETQQALDRALAEAKQKKDAADYEANGKKGDADDKTATVPTSTPSNTSNSTTGQKRDRTPPPGDDDEEEDAV